MEAGTIEVGVQTTCELCFEDSLFATENLAIQLIDDNILRKIFAFFVETGIKFCVEIDNSERIINFAA